MQSKATTVAQYLAELPEDRRAAVEAVRRVILKNLPKGIEEGMQYGMIGYFVPKSIYPAGYHCDPRQPLPFAGLASQKNHLSVYMMHVHEDGDLCRRFRAAWEATGKKLDMGKCCVRFRRLEDAPLEVIGDTIGAISAREFISMYEEQVGGTKSAKKGSSKKKTAKKGASKKAAKKASAKPAAKKASKKTAKKAAKKAPAMKKAASKKVAKKGASKKKTSKKAPAMAGA